VTTANDGDNQPHPHARLVSAFYLLHLFSQPTSNTLVSFASLALPLAYYSLRIISIAIFDF